MFRLVAMRAYRAAPCIDQVVIADPCCSVRAFKESAVLASCWII